MHVDSAESTISMDEHLFSPGITVIGDDFFRCMMSFELFGADFTDKDGELHCSLSCDFPFYYFLLFELKFIFCVSFMQMTALNIVKVVKQCEKHIICCSTNKIGSAKNFAT